MSKVPTQSNRKQTLSTGKSFNLGHGMRTYPISFRGWVSSFIRLARSVSPISRYLLHSYTENACCQVRSSRRYSSISRVIESQFSYAIQPFSRWSHEGPVSALFRNSKAIFENMLTILLHLSIKRAYFEIFLLKIVVIFIAVYDRNFPFHCRGRWRNLANATSRIRNRHTKEAIAKLRRWNWDTFE